MKNLFVLPYVAATACALLRASCAGTPGAVPAWAENTAAAFPGDRYTAGRGASGSRETVSGAPLRALPLYFETRISSRTELAESYSEQDGVSSQSVRLDQQTLVRTETELFAARCAAPWRNGATGLWEAVACIDREEAWGIFEPRLLAETDGEPMRRFLPLAMAFNSGFAHYKAKRYAEVIADFPGALEAKRDDEEGWSAAHIRMRASTYMTRLLRQDNLL